jgi:hypothetical protein
MSLFEKKPPKKGAKSGTGRDLNNIYSGIIPVRVSYCLVFSN